MEECLCIMQVGIIFHAFNHKLYRSINYFFTKDVVTLFFIVAAEMSDKIASIAPISGSPFLGFDNLPDSPISVIDFHGTDDDTIPYDANR